MFHLNASFECFLGMPHVNALVATDLGVKEKERMNNDVYHKQLLGGSTLKSQTWVGRSGQLSCKGGVTR